MTGATVFRRNGPAWRFEEDPESCWLCHRTNRGGVYLIKKDFPMSILVCTPSGNRVEATAEIGAEKIQFDNGDEYRFGGTTLKEARKAFDDLRWRIELVALVGFTVGVVVLFLLAVLFER